MQPRPWLARFARDRWAIAGVAIAVAITAIAVVGPAVAGDPTRVDVEHGLSPRGEPLPPHAGAVLGTDALGRDVAARVVHGAALSLPIAALATVLACALGIAVGVAAGYRRGWVDAALSRLVDLVHGLPYVLVVILLASALRLSALDGSIAPVAITLAAFGWPVVARPIRAEVVALRDAEHVVAARALGARPARVVVHHVLPALAGTVVVVATLVFSAALVAEATLSFLGLGPPPPAPSWGRMVAEGQPYYRTAPWLILAPATAIVLTASAFHLVARGLRDALDPLRAR